MQDLENLACKCRYIPKNSVDDETRINFTLIQENSN